MVAVSCSAVCECTRAGLDAGRARGRVVGRPRFLADKDVEMAKTFLAKPDITVDQVAARLGVAPAPRTAIGPEAAEPSMRWVNDVKARYYRAWRTDGLFGDWTLIMVWGGLGSRRG